MGHKESEMSEHTHIHTHVEARAEHAWRLPMGRGAWWATVSPWGRKESDMTE